LGGDLLPHRSSLASPDAFIRDVLQAGLAGVKNRLSAAYPRVFLILGNDDPRIFEEDLLEGEQLGLWEYMHNRNVIFENHQVYGYACVPPTPFLLKDWERYDVSRFVDVGSIPPEEGWHSVPVDEYAIQFSTIEDDLQKLTGDSDLSNTIFLFHAPPYQTSLDRAALDGVEVEHAPMDVHIGSIAVRRFIETRQPLITLHGHVHESSRLTGSWKERVGRTHLFSAAYEGDVLALVRFDPRQPDNAQRDLL